MVSHTSFVPITNNPQLHSRNPDAHLDRESRSRGAVMSVRPSRTRDPSTNVSYRKKVVAWCFAHSFSS